MRTLKRNKQKMYYSLQGDAVPVYERDENGDIVYTEIDGVQVPVDTGEMESTYGEPVEFFANINGKLSEITLQAFGIDNSANYAEIVADKDVLKLEINAIVWRTSKIVYDENGNIDKDSADYVVRGVVTEALNEDRFLLKRTSVGDSDEN